jgi:hypothetical protein
MLTVKVLGLECENCKKMDGIIRKVVNMMGMQAEVIKVTDWGEIRKYPVLGTAGLVINEKLVCARRVPSEAEVTICLANAEMGQA